ncbi:MAG: hypothetical protein V1865_00710 [bacterium]
MNILNIKNNQGSAITTAIFLLVGITAIAFIGIEIVTSGLEAYRAQGSSSKAYYAAETGIERALMIFNVDPEQMFNECADNDYLVFSDSTQASSECIDYFDEDDVKYNVGNDVENAEYWVKIAFEKSPYDSRDGRQVVLTAIGHYLDTNRSIETRFCIPSCEGGVETDGCGGDCTIEL